MTTVSARAELRDWYWDDTNRMWRGHIFNDMFKIWNDGSQFSLSSHMIKEVRDYELGMIIETKDGHLYTLARQDERKTNGG